MFHCSGLVEWLRNVFEFKSQRKRERKSSEAARSNSHSLPDEAHAEKSTSTESLDSGFIELSESSSSFSLKSILRQNVNNTTGIDPKKKVSICAPASSNSLRGGRRERGAVVVCKDKEEMVSDIPTPLISDVSSQITEIISASKEKLVAQHPELRSSIEVLFEKDLDLQLISLSSKEIADLFYSLRVILFCPPPQHQDIIINKIIDLLVALTNTFKLEDQYEECLEMWSACKSGKYYQNSEFYWTQAQTLTISVWCKIIVL